MNVAARLVHQTYYLSFTHDALLRQANSHRHCHPGGLLSALVLYVTHVTRVFHATYQHNLALRQYLQIQQGQLLLERSMDGKREYSKLLKTSWALPCHQLS